MLRIPGLLVSLLVLVACAGERTPPPVTLDPSNPQAAEAASPAASTVLTPEPPSSEQATGQGPATAEGHEDHGRPAEAHAQHGQTATAADAGITLYACPMHPEVQDSKPSRCPKCGMTLVPVKPEAQPQPDPHASHRAPAQKSVPDKKPEAAKGADAGAVVYACPMHPEVTDTKPSRCPKCGMTLVPRKEGAAPAGHESHGGADGGM